MLKENKNGFLALYALAVAAFGIGTSEFIIMGLLIDLSKDLDVSLFWAGMLITGYALGVVVGAPILSSFSATWPKKRALLILMGIFTIGNLLCAIAPTYNILMFARIVASFSHGAFFGVGAVVATMLVPPNKKAFAISIMFTGLTLANVLGVPFGTWFGQIYGWRSTFWFVSAIGPLAMLSIAIFVPNFKNNKESRISIKDEWIAVLKKPILLGLLTTALGYAGVFAVLTYIAPFLTTLVGIEEKYISIVIALFGVGFIFGNLWGGKITDKNLKRALFLTLFLLFAELVILSFVTANVWTAIIFITLLGFFGFATAAPLQMSVLTRSHNAPTLASALNIAAFNVANALGAWVGGIVVATGISLHYLPLVASVFPFMAIIVAWANTEKTVKKHA